MGELGFGGAGAGMFNRLFDAGLSLGVNYGQQELLGQPAGLNQATRLGLTPGQLSVVNQPSAGFPLDQKTLMIGAALLIGAIVLAKAL